MAAIADLVGEWQGKNRLWVRPDEPVRESETTASVELVAGDRFATVRYFWAEGGEPQDGLLVIPAEAQNSADLFWIDSWHMGGKFMLFQRDGTDEGVLSAKGTYAAPSGPDWGWRIVIKSESSDQLQIVMYNIPPETEEILAVDATYSRSN
jgi:hypothetical protein